jgi:hypothetical protein
MFKTDILTPAIEAVVRRMLADLNFCVDATVDSYSNGKAAILADGYPRIEDVPVMFVGDSTSGSVVHHEINKGSTGLLMFKGGNIANCSFIPLVNVASSTTGIDIQGEVAINGADYDSHKHSVGTLTTDTPITGNTGEPI